MPPARPRWRDRPRPRLSEAHGWRGWVLTNGVLWYCAVLYLVNLVTSRGPAPRPEAALVVLVSGPVAMAMTWVAVLFVKRPVVTRDDGTVSPGELREAEPRGAGYAARAENDRRAWRSR
ncbi:MAG TPA: hypothetical protein VGX28_15550 [Frankiaceae bacterium]|jgi:hypothetical protein|nr:hypothetical protein [Frankiaceae bacterium]